MDPPEFIFPPNKPLDRIALPSKIPVLYDYLFFLDISEHEEFLLGCSNINGQYWEGTLFYYKDSASALKFEHAAHHISTSTTNDAKFTKYNDDSHIVLADASGVVKILSVAVHNGLHYLQGLFYANAPVKQLAVWNNCSKLLLAADKTVALWDMQGQLERAIVEYKDYHTNIVTSVDTNKTNLNLFASASSDRKACIWDDRMEPPATVIYKNEFAALNSIVWNSHLDNLIVGSEAGDVYALDIRQPNEFLSNRHCFDAGVYRIVSNSLGQTAVCGDTSEVLILKDGTLDEVYRKKVHSDFVRGLAWHDSVLYSCGFDKTIVKNIVYM